MILIYVTVDRALTESQQDITDLAHQQTRATPVRMKESGV